MSHLMVSITHIQPGAQTRRTENHATHTADESWSTHECTACVTALSLRHHTRERLRSGGARPRRALALRRRAPTGSDQRHEECVARGVMPLARGFETEQIGDLVDLLIMRGFRDLVVQDERWIFSKVSLGVPYRSKSHLRLPSLSSNTTCS